MLWSVSDMIHFLSPKSGEFDLIRSRLLTTIPAADRNVTTTRVLSLLNKPLVLSPSVRILYLCATTTNREKITPNKLVYNNI